MCYRMLKAYGSGRAVEGDKSKAKGNTESSAFWKSELEARYRSGSDATPFQIRFNQR